MSDEFNKLEMDMMFETANGITMEMIKNDKLSLDDDENKELVVNWLRANLAKSPQILSVLECVATLLYKDDMEREYVNQFINRVRELSNDIQDKW